MLQSLKQSIYTLHKIKLCNDFIQPRLLAGLIDHYHLMPRILSGVIYI